VTTSGQSSLGILRRLAIAVRAAGGDAVTGAVLATLIVAGIELAAVRSWSASWVVLGLMAGLGAAIGAVLWVQEVAVATLGLRGMAAMAVRSSGGLAIWVPLAPALFQGARASELPGARWAPLWLPALAVSATAAALWVAQPCLGRPAARARLAAASALAAAALETGNRLLFPSEYAPLHLALVAVTAILLTVALQLALERAADRGGHISAAAGRRRAIWLTTATALCAAALAFGSRDRDSRWALAVRGAHSRHLVHLARNLSDIDGDGYSNLLGGGDCAPADPRIHPAAREQPGNGIDEDCDGHDLARPVGVAQNRKQRSLAEWIGSPSVAGRVDRLRHHNLLVISIDALRADALAPTPERAARYPHLNRVLTESRSFTRAFAPAAGTDLSLAGFVTGRVDCFGPIPHTLHERLQASGRTTQAVLPSEVLRYAGRALLSRGLDQLIEVVNDGRQRDVGSYTTSVATTNRGIKLIRGGVAQRRPFYVWLHYFDVHEHNQVESSDRHLQAVAKGRSLTAKRDKYLALLELTDREIGRLLLELETLGVADQTILVFFSDHGESLGEHPRLPVAHGRFVYNALTHIPLAVRVPGIAPQTIDHPVSLLDLPQSILTLAGAAPLAGATLPYLVPYLLDDAPPGLTSRSRPLVLNESEQWGLVRWPHKLLVRPADNLVELYDLSTDFAEQRDLSRQHPQRVSELKAYYGTFPPAHLDRTQAGRRWREQQARRSAPRR
jgi:hypothetical protein